MIKIQSSASPLFWQTDNSYMLPNITGQIRWNGNHKYFEVADQHNGWLRIDNTIQLNHDPQLNVILEWAKKKMAEDEKIEKLSKEYPAVKDAKEKLDIIIKLVQNESEPSA